MESRDKVSLANTSSHPGDFFPGADLFSRATYFWRLLRLQLAATRRGHHGDQPGQFPVLLFFPFAGQVEVGKIGEADQAICWRWQMSRSHSVTLG